MQAAYDAVVVGAGHNGLTLALYLQRAGLRTLVVEEADRVGGMARTEEAPAPGFRHNPHANYLAYGAVSPVERDFDLAVAGLATVTPEAQHGLAFADGRPPLILHRRDRGARTFDSLRAYSATDAKVYADLKTAVDGLDPLMRASLYSPPGRGTAMAQV
jgi:phytoene dehydrogenase-like protein